MRNKKIKAWAIYNKKEGICLFGSEKYHIYPFKCLAENICKHFSKHKAIPVEIKLLSPNKK